MPLFIRTPQLLELNLSLPQSSDNWGSTVLLNLSLPQSSGNWGSTVLTCIM